MTKRMKEPTVEFSRPLLVARVPASGAHEKLKADETECNRLAKRFQVPAIHSLTAELKVKPWRGGGFKVTGTATADLEQTSVISLEDFRHTVSFDVERYFLPHAPAPEEDLDVDVINHGEIDLGEVVAETVALELDPYPRKPGEAFNPPPGEGQGS